MKFIYNKICLYLLHINNNVYTFLSGIAISLATNIFTTICIDEYEFIAQWNLYLSTICFALISAVLLYLASAVSFDMYAESGRPFEGYHPEEAIRIQQEKLNK